MGCVPERSLQHETRSYWATSSGTALCCYGGDEDTGSRGRRGDNKVLSWHHVHYHPAFQLGSCSVRRHIQHCCCCSGCNLLSSSPIGLMPPERRQEVSSPRDVSKWTVMLHTLQRFQSVVKNVFFFLLFKWDTKFLILGVNTAIYQNKRHIHENKLYDKCWYFL